MNAKARIVRGVEIRVRKLGLGLSNGVPRHFVAGNPFASAFFAAMSTVFPDGERFFIDSVRHFQPRLDDVELVSRVRQFIGQEAHHGREHETFNAWLEAQGYPIAPVLVKLTQGLSLARARLSPAHQLAMTIALEHFTAIMAHQFLSDPRVADALHPEVRELFLWHAVEETEHKAVAFDVYEAVDGRYGLRALVMLQVTLMFWLRILQITRGYLKVEGNANLRQFAAGVRWLLLSPGPLRRLVPDYLAWFRPGFHPWDQDNRDLIAGLREQLEPLVLGRA